MAATCWSVWHRSDLQPFLQGAPNCTRLVTTWQFEIAAKQETRVSVDEMLSDEAVVMLTQRLDPPPMDRLPFHKLAARLGE